MKILVSFFIILSFTHAQDNTSKMDDILKKQQKLIQNKESLAQSNNQTNIDYSKLSKDEKVNLILTNQEKLDLMIKNQEKILDKIDNDPFKDKDFGIEINLIRLLLVEKDFIEFSGSFSLFYPKENLEIAFPVYALTETYSSNDRFSSATIDIHYRKFLDKTMNGYFLSAFTRAVYSEGMTYSNQYDYQAKLGFGFGIGYRVFSTSGLYWGTSLSIGRYINGEDEKFNNGDIDDMKYIFDIELLKFGYAF